MAITDHTLIYASPKGSWNNTGKAYSALWKLTSDDNEDNAKTVFEYVEQEPELPSPGDPYIVGNDHDIESECDNLQANRDPQHDKLWFLSADYAPPGTSKEGTDENGKQTNDPFDWMPEVQRSTYAISRPVQRARYLEGALGVAHGILARRKTTPIVNSALVPFDPQPEEEVWIDVIRITRHQKFFYNDEGKELQGRINNKGYGLAIRAGGQLSLWRFPAFTLFCIPFHTSLQFINGETVWRNEYELHFNPETWDEEFLDRGLLARACPGDPDGKGGDISPGDILARPIDVEARVLVDRDDRPLSEPVLLDGDGQALPCDGEPVWLKYRVKGVQNFALLPIRKP